MNPTTTDPVDALRAIGFRASRESLEAFLVHATKARLGPVETVEGLVTVEKRERAAINLARRTQYAAIGAFKPLGEFDWNHPRAIDKELYDTLCTLDFVKPGHNVLFRGPSGVGKTTLAKNLGHKALAAGLRVKCVELAGLMADLLRQESLPAFERRLRRYVAPHLLIIDELGYLPTDARAADVLYNIVSRRHQTRSTIITTNLAFKQWTTVFPNASCIGALVDRFMQSCHVIDVDADSWRDKEAKEFQRRAKATRSKNQKES